MRGRTASLRRLAARATAQGSTAESHSHSRPLLMHLLGPEPWLGLGSCWLSGAAAAGCVRTMCLLMLTMCCLDGCALHTASPPCSFSLSGSMEVAQLLHKMALADGIPTSQVGLAG